MEITKMTGYLDGGTIVLITDEGNYTIDSRICTTTKGCIFNGYPKTDNSNICEGQEELKSKIRDAIKEFNSTEFKTIKFDWKPQVYDLLDGNK